MISSIVVPLDGSAAAEVAVPLAVQLAGRLGATLNLLMVHQPLGTLLPELGPPPLGPDDTERRRESVTYLAAQAAKAGSVGGAPVTATVLDGMPGPAIVSAIGRDHPSMIVMSTHGRGAASRFWLGSVADQVVRSVDVPVVLVRPDQTPVDALRSILVPVDLSIDSTRILDIAVEIARGFGAQITLFHVIAPVAGIVEGPLPLPLPVDPGWLDERLRSAEERLDGLAESATKAGVKVRAVVRVEVGAALGILNQLEAEPYDLCAMTTHGEGGLKRLLIGSVADKIIRASAKPVLVLRVRPTH